MKSVTKRFVLAAAALGLVVGGAAGRARGSIVLTMTDLFD
jgi:hypothetical protein